MKKSGFFVAASAAVVSSYSSSSSDSKIHFSRQEGVSSGYTDDYSCTTQTQDQHQKKKTKNKNNKSSEEKFAPRFDGLRFIETLVTAHR
ncbi:hypothetical protein AgCh_007314 [Apium graveolens]